MASISASRTLVTSFNPKTTTASQLNSKLPGQDADFFEEGDWVLCVTSSPQNNPQAWVACGLSNGEIQVYDQNTLHGIQVYSHDALITDMVNDVSNPNALASTAADGTLTIYDIRQAHQPALQAKLPRPEEEALTAAIGFNGGIAAVGTNKAKIHFFDVRNAAGILGSYNQSHTDEITRVRFKPSMTTMTTSTLVSAGEDGLVVVYDTSQPSEEAAIQNILSVQSPVREVGFFGPQFDGIFCLTGSESLLLYHKDESVCRQDFGPNLRDVLSHQIPNNNGGYGTMTPQINNQGNPMPIEYLVDCHWDNYRQELQLLAGNTRGDCVMYNVGNEGIRFRNRLQGGHRGVIRAWNHLSSDVFVTVGEDARLCEWNQMQTNSSILGVGESSHSGTTPWVPPTILMGNTTSTTIERKRKDRSPGQQPSPQGGGGGKMRRARSRMSSRPY